MSTSGMLWIAMAAARVIPILVFAANATWMGNQRQE